jgi:hypothetical protein
VLKAVEIALPWQFRKRIVGGKMQFSSLARSETEGGQSLGNSPCVQVFGVMDDI